VKPPLKVSSCRSKRAAVSMLSCMSAGLLGARSSSKAANATCAPREAALAARKRAVPPARSIFSEPSTLELVLEYLGPGYALFVKPVCKHWNAIYHSDAGHDDEDHTTHTHSTECTSMTAVWGSAATLKLALASGLFEDSPEEYHSLGTQYEAGQLADITTLAAAHAELGFKLTKVVAEGAAASGCLSKLQQLFSEHGCPLIDRRGGNSICEIAAELGSVEMLDWLKGEGKRKFSAATAIAAAEAGRSAAVRYLVESKCPWHVDATAAVARNGDLELLQWMTAHHWRRCKWDARSIADSAACSGSVAVLNWVIAKGAAVQLSTLESAAAAGKVEVVQCLVLQHGIEPDIDVMYFAAEQGALAVVQFLLQQQCECDDSAVEIAAEAGHLEVLQCLHAAGYDADPFTCCHVAISFGHEAAALYLLDRHHAAQQQEQWAYPADQHYLFNCAGQIGMLDVAKALRQQYAVAWPMYGINQWKPAVRESAVAEGALHGNDSDGDSDLDFD
jgi:Ankyrin repeats (3 copies)